MQSALDLALTEAGHAGAKRICSIRLRVGALSGVVPDAMRFAFEALAPGTAAEDATLEFEHVPARFWCAPCSEEFESGDLFAQCPRCGVPSGELRAGRDLEVTSLEIE